MTVEGDFGVIEGDIRINLEVDGDQHYEELVGQHLRLRRQDITRDGILTRAGWYVLRVPAWRCYTSPDSAAGDALDFISKFRQS